MRYKVYFSALLAAVLMFSTSSYADNLAKPKKEVCIQLYSLRTILDGVNKDGKVALYDAFRILRYVILGGNELTPEQKYIMDYTYTPVKVMLILIIRQVFLNI